MLLEKYGIENIRILDGGLPAWKAAGFKPIQDYLRYVAGYPKVRLYEGAWKEYVWLREKSLPAETQLPH